MEIKILGPGCPKCKTLEKLTREVVEQNGIEATVTKVEDIVAIMNIYVAKMNGLRKYKNAIKEELKRK